MKNKIVIPLYNRWDLCNELLWNLYRKERENISQVLIVDDCSPDEEVAGGMKWWDMNNMLPIQISQNEVNLGFLLTSNSGLKYVCDNSEPEDVVILISTDVHVYGKFISQIDILLLENPEALVGGILHVHDTGWNKFGSRIYPYLEGWMLAATVKGWQTLDFFDETNQPHDFEDIDLSTKAIHHSYELLPLNNPGLVHAGGKSISYGTERENQTKRNKEKFREKWVK